MVAATPSLDSNAQAALMILLTAQMQSQTGESSLLQNSQVVGILQNLVSQPQGNGSAPSLNELMSNPVLSPVFGGAVAREDQDPANKAIPNYQNPPVNGAPKDSSPTPPLLANNLNNLLNTQNLNQLLGSLTSVAPTASVAPPLVSAAPPPPIVSSHGLLRPTMTNAASESLMGRRPVAHQRPVLLGDPPVANPQGVRQTGILQAPFYSLPQPAPLIPSLPMTNPAPTTAFFYNPAATLQQQPSQITSAPLFYSPFHNQAVSLAAQPPPAPQPQAMSSLGLNSFQFNQAVMAGQATSPIAANPFLSPSTPVAVGSKRKLPIPPSPEQSPEGPYIGQHSQGIGGHYADSYWRKKTKYN